MTVHPCEFQGCRLVAEIFVRDVDGYGHWVCSRHRGYFRDPYAGIAVGWTR